MRERLKTLPGSIRLLLAMLVASSVVGFVVLLVQGQWSLRGLEQSAVHMAEGKDIVADILPPPLYLVEAHLLTHQVMQAPVQDREALAKGYDRLQAHYDAESQRWASKAKLLAPEVTDALFGLQKTKADAYWAAVRQDFLPAVLKNEEPAIRPAFATLDRLYQEHREGVDITVVVARRWADQRFAEFSETKFRALAVLSLVALVCTVVGVAVYLAVAKRVEALLGAEPDVLRSEMERIAKGDLRPSGIEAHQGSVFSAIKLAQESLRAHVEKTEQTNSSLQATLTELNRLVGTDLLTGLWNRRHLEEVVVHELERHHRYKQPFSVLMLDLDFFKSVNDLYGHTAGDKVLQQVSQCIQQSLRNSDSLARWGGEEFVVLCPNTSLETVSLLAERLRERVSQTPMPHQGITLTASLGAAEAGPTETWAQLFGRLDQALYRAKEEGRNRVCYADAATVS
jgi:diguanylate cyclase (GGDEF)-like protein